MFKLVKEPVAPWPVKWAGVSPAGEIVEQSLTLKLVRIGEKDFRKLFPTDGSEPPLEDRKMFGRLVRGWSDIVGEDDVPLPFNAANIDLLMDQSGFAAAFGQAYVRYWLALPEVREKNSDTPSAGSTAAPEPAGAATYGNS